MCAICFKECNFCSEMSVCVCDLCPRMRVFGPVFKNEREEMWCNLFSQIRGWVQPVFRNKGVCVCNLWPRMRVFGPVFKNEREEMWCNLFSQIRGWVQPVFRNKGVCVQSVAKNEGVSATCVQE